MDNNLSCCFSFRVDGVNAHTLEELESKIMELTADGSQIISLSAAIMTEKPSKI